jgi:hypothetical protein
MTPKQFYDYCERLGEGDFNKFSIVDLSDELQKLNDEGLFRIFHENGYCVTSEKYEDLYREEIEDKYLYRYSDNDFEGFKRIDINKCFELLKI